MDIGQTGHGMMTLMSRDESTGEVPPIRSFALSSYFGGLVSEFQFLLASEILVTRDHAGRRGPSGSRKLRLVSARAPQQGDLRVRDAEGTLHPRA